MSGWFKATRVAWIVEMIQIYGYVNREHIERKFRVSTPQASADLGAAQKLFPTVICYNKASKRYEWRQE